MSDVLKELMKDEFTRVRQDQEQETTVNHIRAAMMNLQFSAEKAMDVLNIPQSQRPIYAALV